MSFDIFLDVYINSFEPVNPYCICDVCKLFLLNEDNESYISCALLV